MIQLFPPSQHRPNTTIDLPASKSISNRALILSMLSNSAEQIGHLADCDDTNVMIETLAFAKSDFDIGAAGTSMRFLTAYLSGKDGVWTLTGSERMKNRPIGVLVDALNTLGAHIEYTEKQGYPPLQIKGKKLTGGKIRLAGNISSQYISALLMVAPTMELGLEIALEGNIISKPYIEMTLQMMADFGVKADWKGQCISIPRQTYIPTAYTVESDWSAASYWYAIASLLPQSKFKLLGLKQNSLQGDSKAATIFQQLGVLTTYTNDGIVIQHTGKVSSNLEYNFIEQPDLAQTVVVCCCMHQIPFSFSGLQTLKIKETDRIAALINETAKLGFMLEEPAEGMLVWNGQKKKIEENSPIKTYEDHRMAMAFAPASIIQPICIEHPEVVSKSYPRFWNDLESTGFIIK